ncbi:hypothetical protein [Halalkalibacter sp. APA_J-10(15)]|nr:hypothetical protein [Halalkalibacter sp. APA_J-10(15)]
MDSFSLNSGMRIAFVGWHCQAASQKLSFTLDTRIYELNPINGFAQCF